MSENKPSRLENLPSRIRQEFTYNGGLYSVTDVCDEIDAGLKPRQALEKLYPTTPKASYTKILTLLKKHPYYIARQDIQTSILKEHGAKLQMNLLDLAFNAKSEMVRYSATSDGLDRVYGEKDGDKGGESMPSLVFNFNLGNGQSVRKEVQDGTIIDQ